METRRIAELLEPFLAAPLQQPQLDQISTYIDLLIRWNARINLTAIRGPEQIVTRHFGESLFAAGCPTLRDFRRVGSTSDRALDVGSGAGFPGIPLKIFNPAIRITLIESNQKKVAFLREVIRALTLTAIDVSLSRAEDFPPASAGLVTLRAVERFETILPAAARLVAPEGRLALLIASQQAATAQKLTPFLQWATPIPTPQSRDRILLIGYKPA